MGVFPRALLAAILGAAAAGSRPGPWRDYRFAPDALQEIDLASETAWTLSLDGGPPRPIRVPGGGWNSDRQDPPIAAAAVKDHVVYERKIEVPPAARGNVVRVLFGGCNYGAEVSLDGRQVAEHHGPMTPFEADLTGVAEPGKSCVLRVKAYHRFHYGKPPVVPVGFDFSRGVAKDWQGNTKYSYGLTGHVRLAVYPPAYVSDVFVRPSAARKSLAFDAWVSNGSKGPKTLTLKATLAPWGGRPWKYPALPERTFTVSAGAVEKVTVEGIPWDLGPESFWWPNVPFREDYQATLHELRLSLEEGGRAAHGRRQRFGFVEYAEGPFYYTVNGVRVNSFGDSNSYGQIGEFDCWTETPCFQPPRDGVKGCPETWKRYQRAGFNTMRLSTSVPTRYMLETADEAGFMLVPEGGSWGNGTCAFHREHTPRQLRETIVACRNHPSVARYSLANESIHQPVESPECGWRWLVDAALETDGTRPYVFEVNPGRGTGKIRGMQRGHAWRMQHYDPVEKGGDHIRGMGECCWTTDGMGAFGVEALKMRLNDYAHFAPWSWINFWPNFLEGMSHDRHPWKNDNHPDRRDGVDGWGSPVVAFVQSALHPYLVLDRDLLAANPKVREKSVEGKLGWPYVPPLYEGGETVRRPVEVFNGGLSGGSLELKWEARWDAPDGERVKSGRIGPFDIEPGFHVTQAVEFVLPRDVPAERRLCLVLESVREGRTLYREERVRLRVLPPGSKTWSARFVGSDEKTGGDWKGKYGEGGCEVVGADPAFPADVRVAWETKEVYTWQERTDDRRALARPSGGDRIAACRYGQTVEAVVDVGLKPRRLSLYCVDWDRQGRRQAVIVSGEDGSVLDRREMEGFQEGRYLTWEVRGRLRISLQRQAGHNAVAGGIFVDRVGRP